MAVVMTIMVIDRMVMMVLRALVIMGTMLVVATKMTMV